MKKGGEIEMRYKALNVARELKVQTFVSPSPPA